MAMTLWPNHISGSLSKHFTWWLSCWSQLLSLKEEHHILLYNLEPSALLVADQHHLVVCMDHCTYYTKLLSDLLINSGILSDHLLRLGLRGFVLLCFLSFLSSNLWWLGRRDWTWLVGSVLPPLIFNIYRKPFEGVFWQLGFDTIKMLVTHHCTFFILAVIISVPYLVPGNCRYLDGRQQTEVEPWQVKAAVDPSGSCVTARVIPWIVDLSLGGLSLLDQKDIGLALDGIPTNTLT